MPSSLDAVGPSGQQFTISNGTTSATITEVGGGLRCFTVDGRPVIDGYDVDEMASAGRGQVLIPWPNRIDGGRYVWEGQTHQLPVNELDRSNAIHGLVRFSQWRCVARTPDTVRVAHTLWPSPGYPFGLEVVVDYAVGTGTLDVTTATRNVGQVAAPYGAGQHPYLLPTSATSVDACTLVVPATDYLETDDRGLPTAVHSVIDTPFDFRSGRRLGSTVLDTAFTNLTRDESGRAVVQLIQPSGGGSVELWLDTGYRYVQVFTGDTLSADRRRASVAVEPMTCPPNAFASGTDVIRLEPGETSTARWGLRVPVNNPRRP
jgi:aldose 1-epimerase